jgi:NAD(P)-dependent dehydrogenase (short-subunit alcohol dehydrogenase family)
MGDIFSLEGRTAIVTGGSRGIGKAIAAEFVRRGARVIITARGQEALDEAARDLGPNAIASRCDNADPADIARMVTEAFQLAPVDILVNNAGISPFYKRAEQVTVEEWDSVSEVNLRGTFFCAVEVARRLFEAGRPGSIINVSSVGGSVPLDRLSAYGAAKGGIHQATRQLALEWADRGVRVNAIAPGWTETDFTSGLFASRWRETLLSDIPMGRFAQPDDVAGAAAFLASDASRYITGTVLFVDGGRSIR